MRWHVLGKCFFCIWQCPIDSVTKLVRKSFRTGGRIFSENALGTFHSGTVWILFVLSWGLSDLGHVLFWASSLCREAQAPDQARAREPHAERPSEAQRGREKVQRTRKAYRAKSEYSFHLCFYTVFVYQSLGQDFPFIAFAKMFPHVPFQDTVSK